MVSCPEAPFSEAVLRYSTEEFAFRRHVRRLLGLDVPGAAWGDAPLERLHEAPAGRGARCTMSFASAQHLE